eukprot:TRINITY_DN2494_c0_g1_i7.p1 TRINITY_DN2494_c0_g1~~TRINITY_DN2494_c0_g1_i7.p1  ORF type:complete len:221 (-),score=30.19 TRINITY_DN2494_c0_g1_i7:244-906(-)
MLPNSIGQLKKLIVLHVYNNQISSVPGAIGQLTSLAALYLFHNPITELPESITILKNLNKLRIEDEGKMTIQCAPIGITALPCYVNDDCAFNGNMKISEALKKLGLYSNHKNENISDISLLIGKWNFCNRINISKNKISTLPDQLSTLTELCNFDIANNMFDRFPDVLLKMTWLTSLNIAGNSISALPTALNSANNACILHGTSQSRHPSRRFAASMLVR